MLFRVKEQLPKEAGQFWGHRGGGSPKNAAEAASTLSISFSLT
jgi:hypothetical protein